jgi:SET domain-containing protein
MAKDNTAPLRTLAPVFDFLNHGTNPNAGFALESDLLVVRATRDIATKDEILIDYGESSTVPAWRCLTSYGFLPDFDERDGRNAVEILVDGVRANVGGDSVPFELVEAAAICLAREDGRTLEEGENIFTPALTLRIADRATEEAQQLLSKSRDLELATEEDTYSLNLAAALRLSQHKVLTSWSAGLREYANSQRC